MIVYSPGWRSLLLGVAVLMACAGQPPNAPEATVRFTDVTRSAGLSFRHRHGGSGSYYYVETMGSGGGFLDYDGDGDLDLYCVNGAPLPGYTPTGPITNVLYRNNGDGTFSDVTLQSGVGDQGYGMGCVVGDYDNDGWPDLYVTNFGPDVLYHNNGDGTFSDVTTQAGINNPLWSTSAVFFDYDNDGWLDLYVANFVDFSVENNRICVRQGIRSYCQPDDFNGLPDVFYRNNGDGTFSDVTVQAGLYDPSGKGKGLGVVAGDFDDDGDQDLYVANDQVPNFFYRNNGDGTFTEAGLLTGTAYSGDGKAQAGMGVDCGDYDRDGDLDLIVTNFAFEHNTLYQNEGNGLFTDLSFAANLGEESFLYLGFGTNFFDYDNDGWLDLFVANGHVIDKIHRFNDTVTYPEPNQMFRNTGQGGFREVSAGLGTAFTVARVSRGAAFGDYDQDGDLDIVVFNCNDHLELLRNDGGNANHWLVIRTVGTRSNRDGIGARVTLIAGGQAQMEEVRSGTSYLSQNDLRLFFGLGSLTQAEQLEIRWPSGLVERFQDLPAGHLITLTEGQGMQVLPWGAARQKIEQARR